MRKNINKTVLPSCLLIAMWVFSCGSSNVLDSELADNKPVGARSQSNKIVEKETDPQAQVNLQNQQVLTKSNAGETWIKSEPAGVYFTKTEVTVDQFKKCVFAGGCKEENRKTKTDDKYCNWRFSGRANHPMNCVNWYGATEFCKWVGGRLPTHDEWYAEASNGDVRKWIWGDSPKVNCEYAIWGGGSRTKGCTENSTWPVCSKTKGNSVSGLCDLGGNVWEWTSTEHHYNEEMRILHGGSWQSYVSSHFRPSVGYGNNPALLSAGNGFRCVRSLGEDKNSYQSTNDEATIENIQQDNKQIQAEQALRKVEHLKQQTLRKSHVGEIWVKSEPAGLFFTQTEVTLGQYKKCVAEGRCKMENQITKSDNKYCNWGYSDRDQHPMNCVNWHGAKEFCQWVGGRLPTEYEWYAEASNGGAYQWPWGYRPEVNCDYAIWDQEDGLSSDGCGKDRTWPVCSKKNGTSVSDLCDMSGNVYEWTSSKHESGRDKRVLRGGAWRSKNSRGLRASYRYSYNPDWGKNPTFGFRCVRSQPTDN